MIQDIYINTYVKLCYSIFGKEPTNHKLGKLVKVSKLSIENLVISIKLLYHFQTNSVVEIDDYKLITNVIIISFILSNKVYNDQSYTFKTWISLINASKIRGIDLKLLKQVETFFLTVIDYNLNFKYLLHDEKFWQFVQDLRVDGNIFKHYLFQLQEAEQNCKADDQQQEENEVYRQVVTPVSSPMASPLITPEDSPMKRRKIGPTMLTPLYNYNSLIPMTYGNGGAIGTTATATATAGATGTVGATNTTNPFTGTFNFEFPSQMAPVVNPISNNIGPTGISGSSNVPPLHLDYF